jgi:hypothetical protein
VEVGEGVALGLDVGLGVADGVGVGDGQFGGLTVWTLLQAPGAEQVLLPVSTLTLPYQIVVGETVVFLLVTVSTSFTKGEVNALASSIWNLYEAAPVTVCQDQTIVLLPASVQLTAKVSGLRMGAAQGVGVGVGEILTLS